MNELGAMLLILPKDLLQVSLPFLYNWRVPRWLPTQPPERQIHWKLHSVRQRELASRLSE